MMRADAPGIGRQGTRSVAALPMYDLPEVRIQTDALWQAIAMRLQAAGLQNVPVALSRDADYLATCRDPDLLLGQVCGYPVMKRLMGEVRIVATPIYSAPGCVGPEHHSLFIANVADRRSALAEFYGSVCALNGFDSNTGMNLLRAAIAPLAQGKAFFSSVEVTGSHYESLKAVAAGRAHLAAIDCVSFAQLTRLAPKLTALAVPIGHSLSTAAPPFITAAKTDPMTLAMLREALRDVAADPSLMSLRDVLFLEGFAFDREASYEKMLDIEAQAIALGYPELC